MACQKFQRLLTRRWEMLDYGMKTVNAFTTVVNQDILWWVLRRGNASRVSGLQSLLTVLVSRVGWGERKGGDSSANYRVGQVLQCFQKRTCARHMYLFSMVRICGKSNFWFPPANVMITQRTKLVECTVSESLKFSRINQSQCLFAVTLNFSAN